MTSTRTFRIARRNSREGLVLFALFAAPVLAVAVTFVQLSDRAWEKLRTRPQPLAMLVMLPLLGGVGWWAQRRFVARARLVLDDQGIVLDSGLPAWLGARQRIAWSEVQKVAVMEPLAMVQIRKSNLARPMALRVMMWVPVDQPDAALPKAGFLKRPDIRATPLWKALDAHGLFAPARADARQDLVNFDLAKHPATRAALFVMAALASYWAIDCYVAREAWAEWRVAYLLAPALLGLAAAVVAFAAIRGSDAPPPVPAQVATGIAIFVGICAGLATWPGLVRLNQLVGGPLEPHTYLRNASCDTLVPVEAGLPPIEYTGRAKAYWCSVPKDQPQTVLVRKGLGGLYQVDLTEHTRGIREFNARAASAAAR